MSLSYVAPCDVACITCQGLAARGAHKDVSVGEVEYVGLTPARYERLESALMEEDYYASVAVQDFMPTEDKNLSMARMRFVQGICFALCAMGTFHHKPGGNVPNSYWVWRIPQFERSPQRSNEVIRALGNQLAVYHTVSMKRRINTIFNSLPVDVSPAILRVVYDALFPGNGTGGSGRGEQGDRPAPPPHRRAARARYPLRLSQAERPEGELWQALL